MPSAQRKTTCSSLVAGRVVSADDERRARLVDEDIVGLVHHGEVMRPLNAGVFRRAVDAALDPRRPEGGLAPLGAGRLQPVAQEVEAELRSGAVGDVAVVRFLAVLLAHLLLQDADRQAEAVVDRLHPFGVAAGQVVVDGGDVNALAFQRVEERPAARR